MKRGKKQPAPKSPAEKPVSATGELTCQPFKARPKLFAALLIGFALWLAALLTLYFTTVYPLRHATKP